MTGGYTQNPVISRLSLALMEDTGWYRANYSMAQPLKWGAGLGCDFVKKSCADWMSTRLSQYDCSLLSCQSSNEMCLHFKFIHPDVASVLYHTCICTWIV